MIPDPFGAQHDPGRYSNVQERVYENVRASGIDDQIFTAVQNAFEQALSKEDIPLMRAERTRMFVQVLRQVLADMLARLGDSQGREA